MTIPQHLQAVFPKQHSQFLQDFFQHCPTYILNRIHIVEYPKQYPLIDTMEDEQYVYILLRGKLQAIEERVVDMPFQFLEISSVDIVGDYEVFTQIQGHYITLKTTEPSLCLKMGASLYLEWMKQDVHALFMRTQMLMKVLSIQTQQQRQYVFMNTFQKLSHYLLDKGAQATQFPFCIRNTREQIASHIGCSVRQVNRIMKQMQEEQYMQTIHGKIYISNDQYMRLKEKNRT